MLDGLGALPLAMIGNVLLTVVKLAVGFLAGSAALAKDHRVEARAKELDPRAESAQVHAEPEQRPFVRRFREDPAPWGRGGGRGGI